MKGTILYTEYDKSEKTYIVVKQTKYGTFIKSVKLHPEDEDIQNNYDGYHFAEMKCDIAAYKAKANYLKQRAIGVEHAYHVILDSCDLNNSVVLKLKRQVDVAWWTYQDTLETYKTLKSSYHFIVENILRQRRELRQKLEKRRKHQ